MIIRDVYGIICQHSKEDLGYLDGGDSCARSGPMALAGNWEDHRNLCMFVVGDEVVRHPYQKKHKDPKETSRDNVVQWASGVQDCAHCQKVVHNYAQKWFVNKDFLAPDVRLYLYTVARRKAPYYIQLLGYSMMWASLIWNTKIKPNDELNQFAMICARMPGLWAQRLISWHPNLHKNIMEYWSGWRDQPEIGIAILKCVYLKGKYVGTKTDFT